MYTFSNKFSVRNAVSVSVWSKLFRKYCSQSEKAVQLSFFENRPTIESGANPLIILHGLMGSKLNWKTLSDKLANATVRTAFAFDLRNHGESPHTLTFTIKSMVNDLLDFMDQKCLEKAVFIGHSLGGRVLYQFAFDYPQLIEKMVIVDIGLRKLNVEHETSLSSVMIAKMEESVQELPSDISLSEARRRVDKYLREVIPDTFIRGFFLLNLSKGTKGNFQWRYNLKAISDSLKKDLLNDIKFTQPFYGKVLLVHGGKSHYVIQDDYPTIQKWFPNIKIKCIAEGNHYLHILNQNEFLEIVTSFINSDE